MQISTALRPAIAMIELIFAIVVIGITLLSIPPLLSTATKSSIVSFQQESIAIAASHTNALMTYAWDEQNTADYNPNAILNVTNGDSELAQVDGTTRRGPTLGLSFPANRLRAYSDNNVTDALDATILLGRDGNGTVTDLDDDIDDFVRNDLGLISDTTANAANQGEYMDKEITISTAVSYGDDISNYANPSGIFSFSQPFSRAAVAANTSTNIKLISGTLTTTEVSLNDKQITLRAFMCNIGAAAPINNTVLY